MAVNLKSRTFDSMQKLNAFAAAVPNNVTTIIQIVFDASSGKWVLFYT
jgi:hypothetical protein